MMNRWSQWICSSESLCVYDKLDTSHCVIILYTFSFYFNSYNLGTVHNCQHFQKSTKHTLGRRGSRPGVLFWEKNVDFCLPQICFYIYFTSNLAIYYLYTLHEVYCHTHTHTWRCEKLVCKDYDTLHKIKINRQNGCVAER